MKQSLEQRNRKIDYVIFMAAVFLQAFVDGYYIADGNEPMALKLLKYALVATGIIWGCLQILKRKHFVFLKELCNLLLVIVVFLVVSMFLIRVDDLPTCLELLIRYSMSILYAFVLLNTLNFDDIYRLMTFALAVSILGYCLEMGSNLFNLSYYARISFSGSYSPFESSYFAASSINCCAFFLYYRRNKLVSLISFLFVLFTFKRPQIVFAILFLMLPWVMNPSMKIRKSTHVLICVGTVFATLLWYQLMLAKNEWIVESIMGQSTEVFTSGRSTLLRDLIFLDYRMGGLGSSSRILGRNIEMELVLLMVEMSLPVMILFVFCFASISGRRIYAVLVMIFQLFSFMTGSGLYNIMGMLLLYLFFGSVNYLQPDALGKKERSKRR